MRRCCFGLALFLIAATASAEDAADRPYLVLQSGGHTAPIKQVSFTPDGKRLISVGEDKTIRIWDAATGEGLSVLRPPVGPENQGDLRAAALSPDGATLAVGAVGVGVAEKSVAPIFLIDLAGGRVRATLKGAPNSNITCLAFSHDGKLLASGGNDSAAVLWDVKTGRPLHTLEGPKRVHHLAFSPNDKLLGGTAGAGKTVRIWSVADGKEPAGPLKQEGDASFTAFAWKDDDTFAAGVRGPAGIRLWDRTGKALRSFDKLNPAVDIISSLAFLPGGKELFYVWSSPLNINTEHGQSGGSFLDLDSGEPLRDGCLLTHPPTAVCGAVSPDGQWAANCGGEGRIILWAVKDGKRLHKMGSQTRTPRQVYWGDPGAVVAGDPPKGSAERQAFDLGELRFPPTKGLTFTGAVHSQADYRLERSRFREIEIKSNAGSAKIETNALLLGYTLLSGDRVAVAAAVGGLKLYDARTGAPIRRLRDTGLVLSIASSPDGRYLLGSFSDHTLRIYDPDKEGPLLSLFVAGADWIVWTEQGYYAASPGGEKLMGWQVNHGLDQLGTFYPAEQFHKAFYRPDVIKRVLAEGSVEKALAAADKESGHTTMAVDLAQALPPEVALVTPAPGKLDKAEVEVKAQAQSKDRPVIVMHLLLDGRPCPGAEAVMFARAKPGDKQEATWKVALPDGEHHLVVLAETDASLGASPEVVVTWQSAAQEPLPTLYVLAAGINAYPGSLKLEWAVDDAAAVQKAFQTGGAPKPYGKVETKLLLDKDASRAGLLAGLDWLKQKMTADDTAVVFYAGHGHRDKKTGQFYLLPQDVDVRDLDKTGVTGTAIKEKLRIVPGRVLVLLDACHSGSIGQSPADPASLTDDVQRQLAAPDCGVVVMCAAMAQEEAGEAAAVKHGFFTAALLMGLGGAAPHGKDGLVHLTALNYYVEEEVAELSKDEQHVVVDRPSTVTSFPLVKPPPKAEEK